MLHFIKRLLGWECCGEWTQWVKRKRDIARYPLTFDEKVHVFTRETPWNEHNDGMIRLTRHWQERQCTLCGRIQERELS